MHALLKKYRIETDETAYDLPSFPDVPAPVPPPAPSAAAMDRVIAEIQSLKEMVRPAQFVVGNIAEAYRREITDLMRLKAEFDELQSAISDTKRQIASIHASAPRTVGMQNTAGELGAVVGDTENATNLILATTEKVEILAGVIQSETTPAAMIARAAEIAAVVSTIYEACNFQDLTGQRITRVVDALSHIENRISRMVDIWGGLDSIKNALDCEMASLSEERETEGHHALVNGPAVVGETDVVNQDDIDALFD